MKPTKCQRALLVQLTEIDKKLGTKRIPAEIAFVLVRLIWGADASIKPLNVLHGLSGVDGLLIEGKAEDKLWFRVIRIPDFSVFGADPQEIKGGWLDNLIAHWQAGERAFLGRVHDYVIFSPEDLTRELETREVYKERARLRKVEMEKTVDRDGPEDQRPEPTSRITRPPIPREKFKEVMAKFAQARAQGLTTVPPGVARTFCLDIPNHDPLQILRSLQRMGWLEYRQSDHTWRATEKGLEAAEAVS